MLGVATVIPNVAIVILSEDSRRPLSVMSAELSQLRGH